MQNGTIADVKETRTMLKDLQNQTVELCNLQKGKHAVDPTLLYSRS